MKGQAQHHIYWQRAALSALLCHGHGSSAVMCPLWMRRVGGISSHYLNTQMFHLSVGIQLDACNWMTENNILEIFVLCALPLSCISPCVQKSLLLNIVYLSTWGGMTWPFLTSAWDLLLFLVISSRWEFSETLTHRYLIMRAFDNESMFHECTNRHLIILVNVSVMETRASAIKIAEAVGNF